MHVRGERGQEGWGGFPCKVCLVASTWPGQTPPATHLALHSCLMTNRAGMLWTADCGHGRRCSGCVTLDGIKLHSAVPQLCQGAPIPPSADFLPLLPDFGMNLGREESMVDGLGFWILTAWVTSWFCRLPAVCTNTQVRSVNSNANSLCSLCFGFAPWIWLLWSLFFLSH